MKTSNLSLAFSSAILSTLSTAGFAHHTGDHAVVLHTNSTWEECAMVLDPSLTQDEWSTFSKDVAPIIYFKPTGGAKPLGKWKFDIGIELAQTEPLKDYEGSWNNTFSHPTPDHWLVGDSHRLSLPVLTLRAGVADNVDVGVVYTKSVGANYGWTGMDAKYAFYHDPDNQVFVATRVSAVMLTGVDDFDYYQGAVDLLVSREISLFSPYAGISALYSIATENTTKVNLLNEKVASVQAVVGSQFNWKYLSVGAEVDIARINLYLIKIGASF